MRYAYDTVAAAAAAGGAAARAFLFGPPAWPNAAATRAVAGTGTVTGSVVLAPPIHARTSGRRAAA